MYKQFIRETYFIPGVYSIKNVQNGRIYIGESTNVGMRIHGHINYLYGKRHPNIQMQDDFNTYGIDSFQFELIREDDNQDSRWILERELTIHHIKTAYSTYAIHTRCAPHIPAEQIDEVVSRIHKLRKIGASWTGIMEKLNESFMFNYTAKQYRALFETTATTARNEPNGS